MHATIAIGDGANDLDMLNAAGLGIAFNAKPVVQEAAHTAVNVPYMDAILYLLGISREEVVAADAEEGLTTPSRLSEGGATPGHANVDWPGADRTVGPRVHRSSRGAGARHAWTARLITGVGRGRANVTGGAATAPLVPRATFACSVARPRRHSRTTWATRRTAPLSGRGRTRPAAVAASRSAQGPARRARRPRRREAGAHLAERLGVGVAVVEQVGQGGRGRVVPDVQHHLGVLGGAAQDVQRARRGRRCRCASSNTGSMPATR